MKFKTLKYCSPVDSKFDEFASIENGMLYTHEHPTWFGDGVTLEDLKRECDSGTDWTNYKIVEIEYFEANTVGADIRNKLSPPKNLVALLEIYFKDTGDRVFDDNTKGKLLPIIKKEMEQVKINIKYIADLL